MKKKKTTFKKTYSKVAILLIIILLFVLVFKALNDGIKVNSFSIIGIRVDGLYLKLDKKLVLEIDNIDLGKFETSKESATPTITDITNIIRRAVWITSFFERLNISNIQYANESSSIYFDGEQFKVDVPYVLAAFRLNNDNGDIFLDIDILKVKKEELDIKGRILYLKKGDIFAFDLESYINNRLDNTINFKGQTDFKHLTIVLDSTTLNSIDVLAPYIRILDSDVYEWIYEKAKFDYVTINRAYLTINNLKSKDIQQEVTDNLYASGLVEKVSLKIEEELSPIITNQVAVLFNKGKLSFKTYNATYDDVTANSGQVDISNFLDEQPLLKLNIISNKAILNKSILGILSYYGIDIPIVQKDGFGDGFINLDILLPTENFDAVVKPNGFFKVMDSNMTLSGVDLFVKEANIYINEDSVKILDSKAKFKDILDTKVDITIDTINQKIDLVANPSHFSLSSKDDEKTEIFNLSNKTINAKMDFSSDDFLINFEDYGIEIIANEFVDINIQNINYITKYSPILNLLDIKNGSIKLHTKDFKVVDLDAKITNLNYPIYNLDNSKISSLNVNGTITENNISLHDTQKRLEVFVELNSGDIDLKANKLSINIDKMMESNIPIFKNIKTAEEDSKNIINLLINGTDIAISLFDYNINFNEAVLKTTQNGFIGNGRNKNGIANIILDKDSINVNANNFNDEFINKMFGKEVVSGGTFGLVGIYRDDKFLGDLTMLDTSIKNMASLQNILSLIDAIPSLIVFKLPGFSTNGYEIENAKIRLGINNEFVALERIDINGSSVDIQGQGLIDLKTQDLNINLDVSTMKSLSSILNKIPIIGYVLLGDDGRISTEMKVTGTINNPTTELSLLEDTAKAPVDIIKRIFTPFQLLVDELKKESEEKSLNKSKK